MSLANSIAKRIRDTQGEISDDETIRFKSYLMSLGISDPVTRETHGSGQDYYRQLAKEIYKILEQPIRVSSDFKFGAVQKLHNALLEFPPPPPPSVTLAKTLFLSVTQFPPLVYYMIYGRFLIRSRDNLSLVIPKI